jgi:hypothetical protein
MAESRLSVNRKYIFLLRNHHSLSPDQYQSGQYFCSFLSVPIREIRGSIPLVAAKCHDKN